jgi:hypothetical protein
MPHYTLCQQLDDDPDTDSTVIEANGDAAAKVMALQLIGTFDPHVQTGYVAVGRGEGADLDWLGAWDFARGSEPVWSPDD